MPPGEDQVERAARARRCAAGAACRRRSAARPSAARGSRACEPSVAIRRSHHSASSRPPARHQPAIAAIVGLVGVRRVKPSGPSGSSRRAGERLDRLEVGAGAERDAARAGEDEHARVVVGLEAPRTPVEQPLGGRAVDGVAPVRAVDGEHGGGADALVADLVGHGADPTDTNVPGREVRDAACHQRGGISSAAAMVPAAAAGSVKIRLPAAAPGCCSPASGLAAFLRRSLRLSSRHWSRLISEDEQREEGDEDEAGVRDDLVVGLAVGALAAVVGQRGGREHQQGTRAAGRRRAGAHRLRIV